MKHFTTEELRETLLLVEDVLKDITRGSHPVVGFSPGIDSLDTLRINPSDYIFLAGSWRWDAICSAVNKKISDKKQAELAKLQKDIDQGLASLEELSSHIQMLKERQESLRKELE